LSSTRLKKRFHDKPRNSCNPTNQLSKTFLVKKTKMIAIPNKNPKVCISQADISDSAIKGITLSNDIYIYNVGQPLQIANKAQVFTNSWSDLKTGGSCVVNLLNVSFYLNY
jgi:hypothetical protein